MILFVRHLVFHDFWLKLFSLVLALLIWLTVKVAIRTEVSPETALANTILPEQTFSSVPVLVVFAAPDARTVRINPTEVQITVRADPRLLQQLHARDLRAQVDLTGIQGARGLRKEIEVTLPPGVTKVKVIPPDVEVNVPLPR